MKNKFKESLRKILNTPDGHVVLKYLKQDYIEQSSLAATVEMTYYNLGQREFVQALVNLLEDEEVLNEVKVDRASYE